MPARSGECRRTLTLKQIARRLDLNLSTVYRWVYSGKLKAERRLGDVYRVSEEDLDRFLAEPVVPRRENGVMSAHQAAVIYLRGEGVMR